MDQPQSRSGYNLLEPYEIHLLHPSLHGPFHEAMHTIPSCYEWVVLVREVFWFYTRTVRSYHLPPRIHDEFYDSIQWSVRICLFSVEYSVVGVLFSLPVARVFLKLFVIFRILSFCILSFHHISLYILTPAVPSRSSVIGIDFSTHCLHWLLCSALFSSAHSLICPFVSIRKTSPSSRLFSSI